MRSIGLVHGSCQVWFVTECEDGFYGLECNTKCVGQCKDGPCNHTTGSCDEGCSDCWTGDHCDTGFRHVLRFYYRD